MLDVLQNAWRAFLDDIAKGFQPREPEPKLVPKPEPEPEWPRATSISPPLSSYPNRAPSGSRSILTRSSRLAPTGWSASAGRVLNQNDRDKWPRAI